MWRRPEQTRRPRTWNKPPRVRRRHSSWPPGRCETRRRSCRSFPIKERKACVLPATCSRCPVRQLSNGSVSAFIPMSLHEKRPTGPLTAAAGQHRRRPAMSARGQKACRSTQRSIGNFALNFAGHHMGHTKQGPRQISFGERSGLRRRNPAVETPDLMDHGPRPETSADRPQPESRTVTEISGDGPIIHGGRDLDRRKFRRPELPRIRSYVS